MKQLNVLLLDRFRRHKTHTWSGHCFADRLGVIGIVLIGFYERLDELWRHQSDSVAGSVQAACPVVRATACLYPHDTGRKVGEERNHLCATELSAKHCFPCGIRAVKLKYVLGDIQSDNSDLHLVDLLSM
jgi:hypothetical protein